VAIREEIRVEAIIGPTSCEDPAKTDYAKVLFP
jgi:hypothetical protein